MVAAPDLIEPRYRHVVSAFIGMPWAIHPDKLAAIAEFLSIKAAGFNLSASDIDAVSAIAPKPVRSSGGTAVIPIFGVLSQRMNLMSAMSGGTSTEQLTAQIRGAVADDSIKSIVLSIDSPGGAVSGIPELAAEIRKAREVKPITAFAQEAASAAYWLGSQASEIVIPPSGMAGSIGVVTVHQDASRALDAEGITTTVLRSSDAPFKVEANQYEPLSADGADAIRSQLDYYHSMFVADIAAGRGVSESVVRADFGKGRMMTAHEAVKAGLADRIATLDDVLGRHGGTGSARMAASEFDAHEFTASELVSGIDEDAQERASRIWDMARREG